MADSIDLVLNAIDNTGPATSSASGNLASFAASAVASNSAIGASATGSSGIGGLLSGLFSLNGLLVVGAGAFAAFGIAAATNVAGIGDAVSDIANSVYSSIQSMIDGTFDWGTLFESVVKGAITGFAILEFGFKNWKDVGVLSLVSIELGVVKFANVTVHFLTEVIPGYLVWFWENWRDIFKTIYDYTTTVVSNMYENLVRFFTAVFEWLQGDGFNFEWVSLTEGFESSIKELPKILEREKGPLETELENIVGDLSKGLGEGMQDNIQKRLKQLPQVMEFLRALPGKAGQIGKDLFQSAFGGPKAQTQIGLPELVNERFTTGVRQSAEQDIAAQQLEAVKKTNGVLDAIAGFLKKQLPKDIRDAAKAGAGIAENIEVQ